MLSRDSWNVAQRLLEMSPTDQIRGRDSTRKSLFFSSLNPGMTANMDKNEKKKGLQQVVRNPMLNQLSRRVQKMQEQEQYGRLVCDWGQEAAGK